MKLVAWETPFFPAWKTHGSIEGKKVCRGSIILEKHSIPYCLLITIYLEIHVSKDITHHPDISSYVALYTSSYDSVSLLTFTSTAKLSLGSSGIYKPSSSTSTKYYCCFLISLTQHFSPIEDTMTFYSFSHRGSHTLHNTELSNR